MNLNNHLLDYKRILVVGGPNVGKSTLAASISDRPVYNTDSTKDLPWSEQASVWVQKLKDEESYVLEGVQAARALRGGLEADLVVYLTQAKAPQTERQQALDKGIATIMKGVDTHAHKIVETTHGYTFETDSVMMVYENDNLVHTAQKENNKEEDNG